MNTKTFNENFELDRKSRAGVRANPKHAAATAPPEIMTGDGKAYDPSLTYFYFDEQSSEIRQSIGLRRDGEHLCMFGLRVVAVSKLRLSRDSALADGQEYFKSEIERLQKRIQEFELEKSADARRLKTFFDDKNLKFTKHHYFIDE